MERRLAAIFAADVVGYSRLMGEEEAGTLSALSLLACEVRFGSKGDLQRSRLWRPLLSGNRTSIVNCQNSTVRESAFER